MTKTYDAIIIGAGHNGLVCASYLSGKGQRVLIVEAADQVGGAAITRAFAPGFRASAGAHLLTQLHPKVVSDLDLKLDLAATGISTMALTKDKAPITLHRDTVSGIDLSKADRLAYPVFKKRMREHMNLLAPFLMRTPPRVANGGSTDMKTLAKLGFDLRFRHGKDRMQDLLRIIGINIFDVLNECFDSELLKGAISLDAILGTGMGPRTPNSLFSYLYRLTNEMDAGFNHSVPIGGMGAVTSAIAEVAQGNGAEVRTGSAVARIIVEEARAVGVELTNGETIQADRVISNADPKTTLLKLVGARNLEAYFAHRINNFRTNGKTSKLHLALNKLPAFEGLEEAKLGNRLVVAPTMQEIERACDHTKYGEFSEKPVLEITIPTIHDPDLAPSGKHVLSAIVEFAPYDLKQGWDEGRERFLGVVLDRIAEVAPNIRECVDHKELLTPVDIEAEFGMTGGHWSHGEMALDQILMMRPVYGTAQYKTPLDGLYLCGAGAHPGGGVMGAAGHNAAQVVLAEESSK